MVRVLDVCGLSEGREAGKSEERKEREGHHREVIPREEIVKRYGDRRERERGSGQAFVKLESFSGGGQSVGICAPSDSGSTATVPASRDARSLGEVLALGSTGVMTPTRNNNYPVEVPPASERRRTIRAGSSGQRGSARPAKMNNRFTDRGMKMSMSIVFRIADACTNQATIWIRC